MLKIFRAIVCLIALLAPSTLQAQQTPQVPTKQQTNRAAESKPSANVPNQKAANPPPTVPAIPTPNLNQESAHKGHGGKNEISEYWVVFGHRLKITDTLLALFTLALVFIGGWQGVQLQRTVSTSKELIGTTVGLEMPKLRVVSAAIGPLTGFYAKETQRERLRAGRVEIRVRNYGKTPAFVTDWLTVMTATESDLPSKPVYGGPWTTHRDLDMPTIGTDGGIECLATQKAADPRLADEQITKILDGRDLLFIWGQIRFEDYEGRAWERGFAFRWEPEGLRGEGEGCMTAHYKRYNYQRLEQPYRATWHDRLATWREDFLEWKWSWRTPKR